MLAVVWRWVDLEFVGWWRFHEPPEDNVIVYLFTIIVLLYVVGRNGYMRVKEFAYGISVVM